MSLTEIGHTCGSRTCVRGSLASSWSLFASAHLIVVLVSANI